jgi:hypothetical protein
MRAGRAEERHDDDQLQEVGAVVTQVAPPGCPVGQGFDPLSAGCLADPFASHAPQAPWVRRG